MVMNMLHLPARIAVMRIPLGSLRFLGAAAGVLLASVCSHGSAYAPAGSEYPGVGTLPGDQLSPSLSFDSSSGIAVWQDHSLGTGWVIRGRRLTASGVGLFSPFTVSSTTNDDQSLPQVVTLKGGTSAISWRGRAGSGFHIYARLLKAGLSNPSFVSGPFVVSQSIGSIPSGPSMAALDDGSFIVTWASDQADGDRFGVLAQHLGANGEFLSTNFVVTQTIFSNQRNPVATPLPGSSYAIGWISENQRFDKSVDVMARTFSANGNPITDEVRLNYGTNICSTPSLAAVPGGGYLAVWSEVNSGASSSTWSIYSRAFDALGNSATPSILINSASSQHSILPKLAVNADRAMVTYQSSSVGNTQARTFAAILLLDGTPDGTPLNLSTVPLIQEVSPAVASVGTNAFMATWTGFKNLALGTEINFRKFASVPSLPQPTVSRATWINGKLRLSWDTSSGGTYQISTSLDLKGWSNTGNPRIAAGSSDSVDVSPDSVTRFFRVSQIR